MPPTTDSLRRTPFTPADADAVVAFCAANGGTYDTRFLLGLTSGADGVIVLADAEGIRLAVIVVDRIRNAADAAHLETLGVRAPVAADAYMRLVVEPALAFARAGDRRALNVVLPAAPMAADGAEAALRDAGFSYRYDTFEMRRPESAALPEVPALPAGWSWAALDVARADEAHAALVEMFRDHLATSIIPLADFRAAVASGTVSWRVLLDGERVAGLVRTRLRGDRGEVAILGRAPAYRGQGIGPRLVAEGLRTLREAGAGEIDLGVEAANERALTLYLRFGFEVVSRTPVFGLSWTGAPTPRD
jgi:ribosomal protein S18 acetylase RimI-like enzyme